MNVPQVARVAVSPNDVAAPGIYKFRVDDELVSGDFDRTRKGVTNTQQTPYLARVLVVTPQPKGRTSRHDEQPAKPR